MATQGDRVRWNTQGSTAYGQVTAVVTSGEPTDSTGDFSMEASEEAPVYRVEVYRQNDDGEWEASGQTVLHREDALTEMEGFPQAGTRQKGLRLDQAAVGYTLVSTRSGQACAGCRWFANHEDYGPGCHIVDDFPAPIQPTGWCERYEARMPSPEPEPETEMPADETETQIGITPASEAVLSDERSATQKIMDGLSALVTGREADARSGVKVAGNHWFVVWSNNFEDREGELFTAKAIDDYVMRVNTKLTDLPELWVGHIKGTRIGVADWVGQHGHFLLAAGTFDNTTAGAKARDYYARHAGKTSVSHGFTYPIWAFDGKHYEQFNTFEITLLPRGTEANLYTMLAGVKDMTRIDEQFEQYLVDVLGKDETERVLTGLDDYGKALEAAGMAYKGFSHLAETPPASDAPEMTEAQKSVVGMIPDLVEAQAEVMGMVEQIAKSVKAMRAETQQTVAQMQAENKALRAELKLAPRASQSRATEVSDPKLQQEFADKESGSGETFWDFAKES